MKTILIISLLFLYTGGSLSIFANEKIISKDKEQQIYRGEYISYIHLVFNDFVKNEVIPSGRNLKIHSKIIYYEFMVEEAVDTVTIRIDYNYVLVREKFAIQIKDGGATYLLRKSDMTIKRLHTPKKIK